MAFPALVLLIGSVVAVCYSAAALLKLPACCAVSLFALLVFVVSISPVLLAVVLCVCVVFVCRRLVCLLACPSALVASVARLLAGCFLVLSGLYLP